MYVIENGKTICFILPSVCVLVPPYE